METVKRIAKSLTAGAAAFATWVGTATADGEITSQEYLGLLAVVVAVAAVWRVPNTPAP